MELVVLGRYGPYPRAGGACSGYLVREGGTTLLVDCGAGTLGRLLQAGKLRDIDAVLLSHLHYDHCSDISVLRYALEQLTGRCGIRSPMPVYAPEQPADAHQLLEYPVFDVRSMVDRHSVYIGTLTVTFHQMVHPVPTFGMEIAAPSDRRLFYTADTAYFPGLAERCAEAEVLLADTCFLDGEAHGDKPVHMTAREAGRLATEARVGRLLCTHLWGGADTEAQVQKEVDIDGAAVVQELGRYTI